VTAEPDDSRRRKCQQRMDETQLSSVKRFACP
jgi:hypothetical protein